MKSGTVKLIDSKDCLIFTEKFKSTQHWMKIIDGWKSLYGEGIKYYFIQFMLDEPIAKKEDNLTDNRKWARPPAIYDNKTSLYGG